jgi:hypothetical protein
MKKLFLLLALLSCLWQASAQVGINSDNSEPDPSAMLDVKSSDKGFLPPRMTIIQRNAIIAPLSGLQIFNSDCFDMQFFNGSGWIPMSNTGQMDPPGSINGEASPCMNANGLIYSIDSVANATGYHWTVPAGGTILSGQGTTGIVVNFGSVSGSICVSSYNDCYRSVASCFPVNLIQPDSVSVTISCGSNLVCEGTVVVFTATPVNGGVLPVYQWMKNGVAISGATSNIFEDAPENLDAYSCSMTSFAQCNTGIQVISNSVIIEVIPFHQVDITIISSNNNVGLCPSAMVTFSSSITNGGQSPVFQWYVNDSSVSGATSSTFTYSPLNTDQVHCVLVSDFQCTVDDTVSSNTITLTVNETLVVNHIAGNVAPITKSVSYGLVGNIPGEPAKCWITSNLGASQQATSVSDNTEASAGWYWQFNRPQGYKHDGATLTPAWTITNINENSDWQPGNDPCNLELGTEWRIPSYTEWYNVDETGSWTNWNGPWNSDLKLHAAGYLENISGYPNLRGITGYYWSGTQNSLEIGWRLVFFNTGCHMNNGNKAFGFSLRCLKNACSIAPGVPEPNNHTLSQSIIIWNWLPVAGASGYKWNITNDYNTATDMGTALIKTETGLTCNTSYTRYVWAYNSCGNSETLVMSGSTMPCIATCGDSIIIIHVAGDVAPVNKTTTYSTVTNIPGEPAKCWITSNLGSDHQAVSVDDATEASAGWYWQFNRRQGYKHDGSTLTPAWTITSISENSDWQTDNDPCKHELGTQWRLPTYTEWNNVDNTGGWTNWNGPWGSELKIHAVGYLDYNDGSLYGRGSGGYYWASKQNNSSNGWHLNFYSGFSSMNYSYKPYGFSVRCIRDN